ncbi:MAG: alkaline phosphatase [Bacteroidota bacterium]|nr:alkaline phosphatase [Bacteroidota bacterium]
MLLGFFISWWLCFTPDPVSSLQADKPDNIILVIGDGMGLAAISIAEYLHKPPSPLQKMKIVGLQKTHSVDNLETDSGAAGTAISCGVKTFNAAIGVGPDSVPVKTILEMARDAGYKTGFVVTSSVVHATPAAFYSHTGSRGSYEEIAKQLSISGIDVFVGGGEKYFYNRSIDQKNLIQSLKESHYEVIQHLDPPGRFKLDKIPVYKKIACFTAFEDPSRATMGRTYLTDLVLQAKKALEARSTKGYFLMIEASQIDWAAHANDQEWLALELQDAYAMLDQLQMSIQPDDKTLLIVTADHETGYISVKGKRIPRLEFNSKVHSSQMVPVFAEGPGADEFLGIYENTAIFEKMKFLLGL